MSDSDQLPLSIVICTYNRAELLRLAVRSVGTQTAPADVYELVVVDNGSEDHTEDVCEEILGELPCEARRVVETSQGLSHARNRGAREARGRFVAFIDDDAQLPEGYVERALDTIAQKDPDILGGPIDPFYTEPKPDWFKDEYGAYLHRERSGWMEKGHPSGSNIIIRRSLLEELKGFDTSLGMIGEDLGYGEETDFIGRARSRGARVYYDLDLRALHHVSPRKYDITYHILAAFRTGTQSIHYLPFTVDGQEALHRIPALVVEAARRLRAAWEARGAAGGDLRSHVKEEVCPKLSELGKYCQAARDLETSSMRRIIRFHQERGTAITLKDVMVCAKLWMKSLWHGTGGERDGEG